MPDTSAFPWVYGWIRRGLRTHVETFLYLFLYTKKLRGPVRTFEFSA